MIGIAMEHKNLTVCKANKVVEASYKLTLNELRVILACIGQVDSVRELSATDEFELSAKDFAKLFAVSENRAYHALLDVTETLFNRYVAVDNPYPNRPRVKRLKMRWISSIEYLSDEAKISLCFSQKILPFLSELKHTFTPYKLEYIGKMTSVYGIRLYELLMQWQSTGKREVEIDWLKKQFQIEEGYERMFDFKKYVIDPAIKDINNYSNLQVDWTQRKTGRVVTHLIFEFSEKQPETAKKPKKTATKTAAKTAEIKVDNIEHFADLRKKYGDKVNDAVPKAIVDILKAQGRW